MIIPNIWENNPNVPNHQSDMFLQGLWRAAKPVPPNSFVPGITFWSVATTYVAKHRYVREMFVYDFMAINPCKLNPIDHDKYPWDLKTNY